MDLAVSEVYPDTHTVWFSEIDPAAETVFKSRFGDPPNLGDIRAVDWAQVEPVDIITAGYPCQPFSNAGKRGDWEKDDRHLWPYVAEAVRTLRPGLVFLENVSGHRNRGFDTVLGALAKEGYDAQWCSVRASDVGAPHRRERLFALANANSERRERSVEITRGGDDLRTAIDSHLQSCDQRWPEASGGAESGRPWADTGRSTDVPWGRYATAVERWEQVTGREAPSPTEPSNTKAGRRLNPLFVEWMMGLAPGWVTGHGFKRNAMLRLLGNGVVPRQGAEALRWLLEVRKSNADLCERC